MTKPAELAGAMPRRSPVVAELPRKASVRLRVLHAMSHATIRKFFDLLAWADARGVLTPGWGLPIANNVDMLLYPLRPQHDIRLRRTDFANFRAEWVWPTRIADPAKSQESAILYLHGGGLVACGLNSHRRLVGRIARACDAALLNVEYRQIPQAHVTETVEDCVEAYRYLLEQGFPAERIVFAGDSAGGGLCFSLAVAARLHGLPMPGAIVAMAPWAHYDASVKFDHPNDKTDALIGAAAYAIPPKWGMAIDGKLDPAWSPVNQDLTGLPPTLIQVSSTEVLLADAEQLAEKCAEAGVDLRLQKWDRAIHVFQVLADFVPDSREAIDDIGAFVRATLADAKPRPSLWSLEPPA